MSNKLPTLIRIYLVVNISWVVRYRELIGEQKVEKVKPIEIDRVEKWKVEKIYNEKNCKVLSKIERVYSRTIMI